MSPLSVLLGSLLTILCVVSAVDIPVSIGGKESNVSSISSVFLPPSLSFQHSKDTEDYQDDLPLAQSDQQSYESLKKELEERRAAYDKNRKEFDSKKAAEEKELEDINKEKELVENRLKEEQKLLEDLKTSLDEEQKILMAEENGLEELQTIARRVSEKTSEFGNLLFDQDKLKKEVEVNLGDCIDFPPKLWEVWGDSRFPNTRLCIKDDK